MKTKPTSKSAGVAKPAKKSASRAKAKPKATAKSKAAENKTKPVKEKRVRGSFAMPERDYALIAELKAIAKSGGRPAKKNELLRAGLHALLAMTDQALLSALAALRPSGKKGVKTTK